MPHARARADSIADVLAQWSHVRPYLDLGSLGIFAAVAHVYWLSTPRIDRLMAEHDINRGLFDVLTVLRRTGAPYSLSPGKIAGSLLLSGSGLTSRLDRLAAKQLVVRLPDPHDGRGLLIRLTPKGRRLVDRVLPRLIRLEARLADGLSREQLTQLTSLLDLWAASMQRADRSRSIEESRGGQLRRSRARARPA